MEELDNIFSGNGIFYCEHITEINKYSDEENTFHIDRKNAKGLEKYFKQYATRYEEIKESRTYVVRDTMTHEIVGYFTLKAGIVSTNEKTQDSAKVSFDTIPAIELANFAINDNYKNNHKNETVSKKPGRMIFMNFILPVAKIISCYIGVKALYIFALPFNSLISYYKSLGFSRLSEEQERQLHERIKPQYDQGCIFMWQLL